MSRRDTLIVCRTRAHQRALLRGEGHDGGRDGGDGGIPLVWTYSDLWERLVAWACFKDGVARDELGARQLAASVLADAGEGGSAVLPRLAPALDALRRELVTAGTSSRELTEALDDDGHHDDDAVGRRGDVRRLLRLVSAVERGLSARGVVDEQLARRRALELLRSGARPGALAGLRHITFHHPIDLSPLDTDIVMALAAVAHTEAIIPIDDAVGRHAVSGADQIFRRLEGASPTAGSAGGAVDVITDGVVGDGPLAPFRGALFGKGQEPDAPVSVVLPADTEEQARLVVSTINAWRRDWPGHTIAVAARRHESLKPVVQALERDSIPVRRRRRTLLESPAARLLLDLAALRTDGMPRDRLIAVLLNQARRDTLHPNDAARVLTTLRKAAVRRDHEDVTQPAGGYRRRLQQLGRRDPAAVPEVDFALRTIEPVMAAAATLPTRARLSAHFDAWLSLARRVVDDGRALGGAEVFEIVARLAAGARRVGDPSTSVELLALTRLVEDELGRQPWLDDDVDVDDLAVEALTLPELAGRTIDLVIVVQAVEGELPLPATQQASLLNDVDRIHLNTALGRRALPTAERERGDRSAVEGVDGGLEGLWWLLGLKAARQRLVLLAPRREARGRELAPSAFLLDAARALGVSPAALQTWPMAGVPLPRANDRRQRRIRRATALADGAATDLSPADVDLVEGLGHARTMAREREQWFAQPDAPFEERRGPHAFAVDDKRIARSFANAFGLHKSRPLTPTRLEAMAACRMHGFVQHVLKIDVDTEAGNAIEARVAGTFAHTVFERFYMDRATHGVAVSRFDRSDRTRLGAIIDEETTRSLQTASGHLPALRAALHFMKTSLIRVVATVSAAPPVMGVEPRDFELQIGVNTATTTAAGPPAPIAIGGGRTIFLGGIIDRVDEGPGGRVVIDYKTMSAARVKEKAAPSTLFESHFQLLVYLRLLEHHRPTAPNTPLHGYLMSLKDGAASKDIGTTESLRLRVLDDSRDDSLGQAIGRVISPILDGTLPPDAGGRCTECRLQRVCRVPLEGAYHLDPDELEDDGPGGGAAGGTVGAGDGAAS